MYGAFRCGRTERLFGRIKSFGPPRRPKRRLKKNNVILSQDETPLQTNVIVHAGMESHEMMRRKTGCDIGAERLLDVPRSGFRDGVGG